MMSTILSISATLLLAAVASGQYVLNQQISPFDNHANFPTVALSDQIMAIGWKNTLVRVFSDAKSYGTYTNFTDITSANGNRAIAAYSNKLAVRNDGAKTVDVYQFGTTTTVQSLSCPYCEQYGWALAMSQNFLVVGAPYTNQGNGNVLVYDPWTLQLLATVNGTTYLGAFGGTVAVYNNYIAVSTASMLVGNPGYIEVSIYQYNGKNDLQLLVSTQFPSSHTVSDTTVVALSDSYLLVSNSFYNNATIVSWSGNQVTHILTLSGLSNSPAVALQNNIAVISGGPAVYVYKLQGNTATLLESLPMRVATDVAFYDGTIVSTTYYENQATAVFLSCGNFCGTTTSDTVTITVRERNGLIAGLSIFAFISIGLGVVAAVMMGYIYKLRASASNTKPLLNAV